LAAVFHCLPSFVSPCGPRPLGRRQGRQGRPVTHAAGEHGPAIVAVLKEEGVDFSRVVLGHSGDAVRNPDYLAVMADIGLTLGMDRFGIDHSDLVVEMCRRGYGGRMVLAHHTCCYIDWFGPDSLDDLKDWHYLHVSQDVLSYLREHGVPESDIDTMLAASPARILAR
jgi:phosphotriesterase-related protein